jgi:ATP-binding cassette subfamily G (WHITE) protein 2 (SNQ2)
METTKIAAEGHASEASSEKALSAAVKTLLQSQSGEKSAAVKSTSLSFEGLGVRAESDTIHPVKTLPQAILNTFGPDQINFVKSRLSSWYSPSRDASQGKAILTDFTGLVKPGEMLFVLGRPGSGCSTFLRTAANRSALSVSGKLAYGNMSVDEFSRHHERETVYLPEEDRHIATLSVRQTLTFALRTSLLPRTRTAALISELVETIAGLLGLTHALDTSVGGAFVPGVSGGERKRQAPSSIRFDVTHG